MSKLTALKQPGKLNLGDVKVGDAGEARRYFWVMNVPPGYGKKEKKKKAFSTKIRGGGGRERCAAARLSSRLCQGYKQAVIRPPNGIILPVSAPEHMGPHKAEAAPDRHPLLITQRRGAGPFLLVAFPISASVFLLCRSRGNTVCFEAGGSETWPWIRYGRLLKPEVEQLRHCGKKAIFGDTLAGNI